MKEYFKMSDVFPSEIYTDDESGSLIVDDEGIILESFSGDKVADYALHAINSHDELVEMNKELLEALEDVTSRLEWLNSDDCGHIMAATDNANSIIAKAKGGTA